MKKLMLQTILCSVIFFAAGMQGNATDHAYPYSQGGKWGVCDKNRQALSAPKYDRIQQRGQFIIGELGNPYQNGTMEVYSTEGRWMASCCSYIFINDTVLVTFPFEGYERKSPADGILRKEKLPFYSLGAPKRLHQNGRLESAEFQQYLISGKEKNASILYASGRKVQTDFKVLEFTANPGVLLAYTTEGTGMYDVINNRPLTTRHYKLSRELPPYFILLWNSGSDYQLADFEGRHYAAAALVHKATYADTSGILSFENGEQYSFAGSPLPPMTRPSSAQGVWLLAKGTSRNERHRQTGYNDKGVLINKAHYLTDTAGRPLLLPGDNPDSIINDLGQGLMAIAGIDGDSNYVQAIYNGDQKKVIARAKEGQRIIPCRNNLDEFPFTAYLLETQDSIIVYNRQSRHVFSIRKEKPAWYPKVRLTPQGFLEYGEYKRQYSTVGRDGAPLVFDDFQLLNPGNPFRYRYPEGDYYFRIRKGKQYGIIRISYHSRNGNTFPEGLFAEIIVPLLYDAIDIMHPDAGMVFLLRQGDSLLQADHTGALTARGASANLVMLSGNGRGYRFAWQKGASGTDTSYIVLLDPAGNILRRYPANTTIRDIARMDDSTIAYISPAMNDRKNARMVSLNPFTGRQEEQQITGSWNFIRSGDKTIAIDVERPGHSVPLIPVIFNVKGLPLPIPVFDGNDKLAFIPVQYKNPQPVSRIAGYKDKRDYFVSPGNRFFDGYVLYRKGKFAGVLSKDGQIFD